MDEIEPLEEALQLAGWLLADQIYLIVDGGVVNPRAMIAYDEIEGPRLLDFRGDHKSHELAVIGKNQITNLSKGSRAWAYAYLQDLGPAGKLILMELGGRGLGGPLVIGQRYETGANESEFAFVGDLQILGRELLPLPVLQALEDSEWRDLIAEGALSHPSGEERWDALRPRVAPGQMPCRTLDFQFTSPSEWVGQPGRDERTWMFFRPFPCDEDIKSSLYVSVLVWEGAPSLEVVVEQMRQTELKLGHPVLEARVIAFPSLGMTMGRLSWEEAEKSLCRQAALFPAGEPGHFLYLQVESPPESQEEAQRALNEVLASLHRGPGKSKSLWKKWTERVLPKG